MVLGYFDWEQFLTWTPKCSHGFEVLVILFFFTLVFEISSQSFHAYQLDIHTMSLRLMFSFFICFHKRVCSEPEIKYLPVMVGIWTLDLWLANNLPLEYCSAPVKFDCICWCLVMLKIVCGMHMAYCNPVFAGLSRSWIQELQSIFNCV